MQVIIISSKSHRQWHLSKRKVLIGLSLLMSVVAISAINMSKWFDSTQRSEHFSPSYLSLNSENTLTPDYNAFIEAREQNIQDYYAKQLGGLQAETIRLRMLSERLAEVAGFDTSAFSLDEHPAQGGLDWEGTSLTSETLERGIDALSDELRSQQDVLSSLEQYILTKDTIFGSIPTGKPVDSGWVSSFYGYRIDPFNGKKTFHQGIDIAGKVGSEVHAVAEGIVTWVGNRGGYGSLVEVDHGNGYVTRYAHNEDVTVEKGQRVSRGDTLALMGSTGRSTGPHVHFEVLRDGRHVNPYNFIK